MRATPKDFTPEGYPVYDATPVQQPKDYSAGDNARWHRLFQRQQVISQATACPEFLAGLGNLKLDQEQIPHFEDLSFGLTQLTGWRLQAVDGLLPSEVFFKLLASKIFPTTWWLRDSSHEDYIVEPDLFHDCYGHVPLLSNPAVAFFIEQYAQLCASLEHDDPRRHALVRFYWYTIEFGLVLSIRGIKTYGAGIISSPAESYSSTIQPFLNHFGSPFEDLAQPGASFSSSPSPALLTTDHRHVCHRLVTNATDCIDAMRYNYGIADFQPLYFVLPSLDFLLGCNQRTLLTWANQAVKLGSLVPFSLDS